MDFPILCDGGKGRGGRSREDGRARAGVLTERLQPVVEAVVLSWVGGRRSHGHVFRIGDGPSPLAGLDGLIFAAEASFEATVTRGALFVALFLFLFAARYISLVSRGSWCHGASGLTNARSLKDEKTALVSRGSLVWFATMWLAGSGGILPARERRFGIFAGTGLWYSSMAEGEQSNINSEESKQAFDRPLGVEGREIRVDVYLEGMRCVL